MSSQGRTVMLLWVLLLGPAVGQAHHSWRAVYDGGEEITIDAVVASAVYRNPHPTVRVEIANDAGELETWTIEWRGGRRRDGEPAPTYDLSPGDAVLIEGQVARYPRSKKIQMFALTRQADGMRIEARRGGGRRGAD